MCARANSWAIVAAVSGNTFGSVIVGLTRSMRVVSGSGGISPLGEEERNGIAQTIDEEVLKGGNIFYRSRAV